MTAAASSSLPAISAQRTRYAGAARRTDSRPDMRVRNNLSAADALRGRMNLQVRSSQLRQRRDFLNERIAESRKLNLSSRVEEEMAEVRHIESMLADMDRQLAAGDAKLPSRERDPRGDRYNRAGSYQHGAGLGRAARRQAVDTAVGAVDDPLEAGKRIQATINRRVDVLEMERGHGRITVSQYEVGRQVQAILERASGARSGGGIWNGPSSRDQVVAHELAVIYALDDARLVDKLKGKIIRAVGKPGARFLGEVLTGRQTFGQFAEARGKAGDRGTAYVAEHFRILLEYLDADFAAEGVATVIDRFFRTEDTGEVTDERGRVVPAGHGHAWGGEESRYAPHMNSHALNLAGRDARVRDRVGARHRVAGDEA